MTDVTTAEVTSPFDALSKDERLKFNAALRGEVDVSEAFLAKTDGPLQHSDLRPYLLLIDQLHATDDQYDFGKLIRALEGDISGVADNLRAHASWLMDVGGDWKKWMFSAASKGHPAAVASLVANWMRGYSALEEQRDVVDFAAYLGKITRGSGEVGRKLLSSILMSPDIDFETKHYFNGLTVVEAEFSHRWESITVGKLVLERYRVGEKSFADALAAFDYMATGPCNGVARVFGAFRSSRDTRGVGQFWLGGASIDFSNKAVVAGLENHRGAPRPDRSNKGLALHTIWSVSIQGKGVNALYTPPLPPVDEFDPSEKLMALLDEAGVAQDSTLDGEAFANLKVPDAESK